MPTREVDFPEESLSHEEVSGYQRRNVLTISIEEPK